MFNDWDFWEFTQRRTDLVQWIPKSDSFQSPPTSVFLGTYVYDGQNRRAGMISRFPSCQNLPEGQLVFWTYGDGAGEAATMQALAFIGVKSLTGQGNAVSLPIRGGWAKRRVTWWLGRDPAWNIKLIVSRESAAPGRDWEQEGLVYHDPLTGSVNRVGVGFGASFYYSGTGRWLGVRFDDLQIWG